MGRFDGFEEAGIFGPVVEGGAVDIEFRGDGGDFESEAEGDSSGGLDGSQIGVEICRFRGMGRMGEVCHTAPRMKGVGKTLTVPFLEVVQNVGEINFN